MKSNINNIVYKKLRIYKVSKNHRFLILIIAIFIGTLDELKGDLKEIKQSLQQKFDTTNSETGDVLRSCGLFVDFHDKLLTCFKCLICAQKATSPIILGFCCKQMIGCNTCVERWLDTHTTCPHCRNENGAENLKTFAIFDNIVDML